MKNKKFFGMSLQMIVAITVLFGVHSTSQANTEATFKPIYKVDRCDCLGFSEDIPTFLSDLAGTQDLGIYGEGPSLAQAEKQAQHMCKETYRSYASASVSEDVNSVTQSGCQKLQSTPHGEWVSL
jgi:hypothetical protein